MLLLTYSCNLNCIYCYEAHKAKKEASAEDLKQFIMRELSNMADGYDKVEIQFMGGEPLLRFDLIREVSEWLWRQTFEGIELTTIFVPTNGTLLNREMRQWFADNKDRICLGLSFDGDDWSQDANRCDSARAVDIDFFAQTWPWQSVKMTISPDSVGHLKESVLHLSKHGFEDIAADLAMGLKVCWTDGNLETYFDQLIELTEYYVSHPKARRLSLLNVDIFAVGSDRQERKCSCGQDLVCIDCDGERYACHLFAPVSAGLVKARQSQSLDFEHIEKADTPCKTCMLYATCNMCYGMNYLTYNDIMTQNPFSCRAFKVQFLANCILQKRLAENTADIRSAKYADKLITYLSRQL